MIFVDDNTIQTLPLIAIGFLTTIGDGDNWL
jgi:hypothetical protein